MAKNKLLYLCVGIILAALLIFIIIYTGVGFEFNTETHAEWEQNGITFTYKGSKNEIRRLNISKEGKSIEKIEISAEPTLFSAQNKKQALTITTEENTLLLFPFSIDKDGNKHYRTLCLKSGGTVSIDANTDIINPTLTDGSQSVICESLTVTEVGDAIDELGAPYEEATVLTVYQIDGENLCPVYELSVIYYSENNVYCISKKELDIELGTLGDSVDDWLSPDEYAEAYETLDKYFNAPLPQKHT